MSVVGSSKMHNDGFNAIRIGAVVVSLIMLCGSLQLNAFDTPGWKFGGVTEINHNAAARVFIDGIFAVFFVILMLVVPVPFIIIPVGAILLYVFGKREMAIAAFVLMIAVGAYFRLVSWCAWLANPALACSWFLYLMARYRAAAIASALSGVLAASFMFVGKIPYGPKDYDVEILSFGEGYWMWLGSIAIMLICCNFDYWLIARSAPQPPRDAHEAAQSSESS